MPSPHAHTCGSCGIDLADLDLARAPSGFCSTRCAERFTLQTVTLGQS